MTITKSFKARSVAHPLISYTVSIHDTESTRQPGANAVGIIVNCEAEVIATLIAWTTPDGNIAAPDLNPGDLGAINVWYLNQQ